MIYTFYSYKGGVGRSMALANIAELCYEIGLRVLMVDWDLEAPGLEQYFDDQNPDFPDQVRDMPGIIEMLLEYKNQISRRTPATSGSELPFTPIEHYLVNVRPINQQNGGIWLLPAGRRSPKYFASYANTVLSFDWKDFYDNWGGELYIEWLRREIDHPKIADIVLIDSRTGVTEMGGVCTYQLADVVVAFCAANNSNLQGVETMVGNFRRPEVQILRTDRPLEVLVVPARIEVNAEGDELNKFQHVFLSRAELFAPPNFRDDPQHLWNLAIPYSTYYAYREAVAVRDRGLATATPLVQAFEALSRALAQLAPIGSRIHYAFLGSTPHQLRGPVADFIGRTKEIDQLVSALMKADSSTAAIACVRGLGGIGKTELAYTVAQSLAAHFPDAQLLVELRGASKDPLPPTQVLQTVIRAFEREAKLPDDLTQLQSIYRSLLNGKRVLILADDAKDAVQVRSLIPPPGCALLVTSRNRFSLPGMMAIDLGALPAAEAEGLLLKICPRIGQSAGDLAKLCGYLPLALRVSASLLKENDSRDVGRYLEQLRTERLKHLSDPDNPDDPQASVEASLRLSYDTLTPDMQAGLCQLSVFPTSFDEVAAAVVVAEGNVEVLDILQRRCLLEWDASVQRFSLNDLVRAFVATRLEDVDAALLRHAQHYAQVANQANQLCIKGDVSAGLALFDRERNNIDAGWAWALKKAGTAVVDTLVRDYTGAMTYIGDLRYDKPRERILQLEAALAATRRQSDRSGEAAALGNLGVAYAALGETRWAIDYHEQVIAVAREFGDRREEGNALGNLGLAYYSLGEVRRAIDFYEQHLAITREIGDRRGEGNALGNLGLAYADLGELRRAIEYHGQCLEVMRELGDRRGEGNALGNLGNAYYSLGEVPRVIAYHEQALAITRELSDRRGEGNALGNLGNAYYSLGDVRRAVELYEHQLIITRELGDRRGEGNALGNLGNAYYSLGDVRRAIDYHEQALTITRELGDRRREGNALSNLGLDYYSLSEAHRAIELYEQALTIDHELGDRRGEGNTLGNLGLAYYSLGELHRAMEIYERRLVIAHELGDRGGEAIANWNLGLVLEQQGDLAGAIELMQACVDYEREVGHPNAEADGARVAQLHQRLIDGE